VGSRKFAGEVLRDEDELAWNMLVEVFKMYSLLARIKESLPLEQIC
jgi:hypothetical protein